MIQAHVLNVKTKLGNKLGLEYPVDLMMGVGYPSNKDKYLDPNTNTMKEVFWEHLSQKSTS